MKRTQEELEQICCEISNAIHESIAREERKRKLFGTMRGVLTKYSNTITPLLGLAMEVQMLEVGKILDKNPAMKRKIERIIKEHEEAVERL